MNIIQKYKLKKVLKNLDSTIQRNYDEYPDYIKYSDEVLKRIFGKIELQKIDSNILIAFIKKYPEYINKILCLENIEYLFTQNPELIKYVEQDNFAFLFDIAYKTGIFLSDEQFNSFNDIQKKDLINKNSKYFNYCNNKSILKTLNLETQLQLYSENNDLFCYLSFECKEKIIEENKHLIIKLEDEEILELIKKDEMYVKYCDNPKIVLDYLKYIMPNTNEYLTTTQLEKRKDIFNYLYNKGYINEMYNDSYLLVVGLQDRLNNFPKLYQIIISIFQESKSFRINRNDNGIKRTSFIDIKHIIAFLNDDVLLKNSEKELIKYFENPTSFTFKKIIINTYGQQSMRVLNDRPNINLDMVEEPTVFDNKIIDSLGINFINQLLNYKVSNLNYFIHCILEDEFLLNNFKTLYYYIIEVIGEGIDSIDLAIKKFIGLKKILEKHQLMDLLLDKKQVMNFILFDETTSITFNNIEQLDTYNNTKIFDNNYKKDNTYKEFNLYSGLNDKDFKSMLSILEGNIDIYGILNEEDLEILQTLKLLKEKYINQHERNIIVDIINQHLDKFNPKRIHEIYQKVKRIYSYDFNQNVIKNKNNYSQLCEVNIVDGVEIVDLKGEEFCFLVSGVNEHTLSVEFSGSTNKLTPNEVVQNWLELDNGTSTISTSLLSETCIISEANAKYDPNGIGFTDFFGFDNFEEEQILTFKSWDTGASHYPREIKQNEDICFAETYERIVYRLYEKEGHLGYLTPKANETVIRRYDNKGKRIVPNFILVYDNDKQQLSRAIEMVKCFALLGYKLKIYRINTKYYANKTCTDDSRYNESPKLVNTSLINEIYTLLNNPEEKEMKRL